MAGHLFEWCLNKYKSPEIVTADASGDWRVLRGGSFDSGQVNAAAACRNFGSPSYDDDDGGFRLVVAAPISAL